MMDILVTGSEGSLMQWTIKHLVDEGHHVIGIDNRSRYDDYEQTKVVDPDTYEFYERDLTHLDAAISACDGVDGIINAAAMIYGVKGFHEYPATILSNDVTIHRNILKAATEHNIERVAYVSSSMVYEQDDPPHNEDDVEQTPVPSTDYGLSKIVGERYSRAFRQEFGINYTIWRPFNIITPYEKAEDEPGMSHVFADFIQKILIEKQNPMEIFGSGEQVRCFTWIDEVAETITHDSFSERAKNHIFNLANPEPVTMKELAHRIFEKGKTRGVIDDKELKSEHVPIYDDDVKERIPSVTKAKEKLGWDPEMKLDDSLDACIDHVICGRM